MINNKYKTSRKSGGRAWKESSDDVDNLIDLFNLFHAFERLPRREELREPGFKEYLRFLGLKENEIPSGDYVKTRIEQFFKSSQLDPKFLKFKLSWLKEVVCLMPERLALDILNHCPAYKTAGVEGLLSFMRSDDAFNAFENVFIEEEDDELTQSAEQNFLYSMRRYEELSLMFSLLRKIVPQWQKLQNAIKGNKATVSKHSFSPEFEFPVEFVSHLRIILTSDFRLRIHFGNDFEVLSETDFSRIKICSQCDDFFWAGRKDMSGCRRCSVVIRRKRWRDKRNQRVAGYSTGTRVLKE